LEYHNGSVPSRLVDVPRYSFLKGNT